MVQNRIILCIIVNLYPLCNFQVSKRRNSPKFMAGKHVGWGGKGGGDDDDYYPHEKESVIMKSNKDHRVKLIILRQPPAATPRPRYDH